MLDLDPYKCWIFADQSPTESDAMDESDAVEKSDAVDEACALEESDALDEAPGDSPADSVSNAWADSDAQYSHCYGSEKRLTTALSKHRQTWKTTQVRSQQWQG